MINEAHNMVHLHRRQQLMASIGPTGAIVLVAYPERPRSKNINYRFVQDKDFFYLTGFEEPDAVALLRPEHPLPFILFSRPKDPYQETSYGARAGIEGCINQYGADAAYSLDELAQRLPELLEERTDILVSDELDQYSDSLWKWCNQQRRNARFDEVKHCRSLRPLAGVLHPMRVIKDGHEIQKLRTAINASCSAHRQVIAHLRPGINEAELSAQFNLELARHGCVSDPYPNIVAGGERAMCLHYDHNNHRLEAGSLLLIDAGGEFGHYSADITRTYPVSGHFSDAQRTLYQLVLSAIDAAIAQARPGATWNTLYDTAMTVLTRGLIELGILSGSEEHALTQETHKAYTVHKTGHWLGLDVHDVGPYRDPQGQWRQLEPGMVLTIEPGLYFSSQDLSVEAKWRGIAIRIEDDILITATGCEVLSANAPRTIDEIETLMA
ncbi:aminopeptidase P N-terminal domain-containing protein [Ferrimonas sp. SCSIO 43195]|uniref:aminopeptidase P N-terminal domain-containing protein n=1 Tax=Ferrimonas sp. SCSIO 43195 TaxID=2822844 RepID=UPI0020757513|nr:aminopeptidase P N-terminal domain-containing protein [Ferrimonas sp. SCSIO 43195]USD39058.1 aminopeptidase P N-terminal domain-containing protein [Ferrimonas sp. SCSIO 43195]